MKVAMDVDYRSDRVVAACVGFEKWDAEAPAFERARVVMEQAAPYQPGEFYRRELPYLLALLAEVPESVELIVVDGYVWLDGNRPGLGAHLHAARGGATAVIGVAKRRFRGAEGAAPVLRGQSREPLFVSAVGLPLADATAAVLRMHGAHRIPTLLKRADRRSRE